MPFLIVSLLAIFAVVMVAYPFFRRGDPRGGLGIPRTTEVEQRRRREEMYQEIRALQMEFQLGTLEEPEYRRQLQVIRMEAARSIRDEELSLLDRELEERIFSSRTSSAVEIPPPGPGGEDDRPSPGPSSG